MTEPVYDLTDITTEEQVRSFLLEYAWLGTREETTREVECIMAQRKWEYLSEFADRRSGAQWDPSPDTFKEAYGVELTALYECHDGPHLNTCPRKRDDDEPSYDDYGLPTTKD